jgi:hypothetical protein
MRPIRTPRQQRETLDYMADLLAEMSAMAARDDHRLLGYILHTGCLEIEALKQTRGDHALSDPAFDLRSVSGDKEEDAS